MKKKILSVIMAAALVTGTYSAAVAADRGGATRNELKSYGSIEYRNGSDKVVINSEDLYMLADQIDLVKLEVTDQLEAMNTYFTAGDGISLNTVQDVSVTHAQPDKADFVDPLSVNFDTLMEGVAASQSVSPAAADYGYPAGTKFYKKEDGSLTTNGSEEGVTEISIAAATAENLSAGTAAWVNGQLILGTGGDNKSYFDTKQPSEGEITSPLIYFDNKSGYELPEDLPLGFVFVDTTGTTGNSSAPTPLFSLTGYGYTEKIYSSGWASGGFNHKWAIYKLVNVKKGAVIKGSSGKLFY